MTGLITGAGGFIGSHLTQALLRAGWNVRALVHYNSQSSWGHLESLKGTTPANLDVKAGDVTDPYFVEGVARNCDVVFHLAALIGIPYSYHAPASYVWTNTVGTLNVLEACRRAGVRRVIVTSTSEVYGTALCTPITEGHPLQAQSPYAASKIGADKLAESYFRSFGLPVVILRPFNTYGPRQSARAVIPAILSQALTGKQQIRLGNSEPQRDWVFVDDTVRAFVLAADAPGIEGEVIHLGTGVATRVGDIARKCTEAAGSHAPLVTTDERTRPRSSEVDLLVSDPAKARKLLGWRSTITLDEGVERTACYIREHLTEYCAEFYTI